MSTETTSFSVVPDNLGCMPVCTEGHDLSEALRMDIEAGGDDTLAREIVDEIRLILDENGCQFIKDGRCALVGYLRSTALAYRITFERDGRENGRD